jgi:DNA-binding CsgD family transcriptional regulator
MESIMIITGKIDDLPAIKHASDTQSICDHFLKQMGLNYFGYFRIYKNRKIAGLVTNPHWCQYFIESGYTYQNNKMLSAGIHLWENTYNPAFLRVAKESFNFVHGLYIVTEYKNYTESCVFAAPLSQKNIFEFYFNHIDLLKKFIQYFNQKANKLILKSEQQKIFLPGQLNHDSNQEIQFSTENSILKALENQLLAETQAIQGARFELSPREQQCLVMLAKGYSAKMIAREINISHRTIEYYIANLKKKMNCCSKNELIKLFHRTI